MSERPRSRIRIGQFEVEGLPAILFTWVVCVVAVTGIALRLWPMIGF